MSHVKILPQLAMGWEAQIGLVVRALVSVVKEVEIVTMIQNVMAIWSVEVTTARPNILQLDRAGLVVLIVASL